MKSISLVYLFLLASPIFSYAQWEEKNIATSDQLRSVDFQNDETGFVASLDQIYKTSDGGKNWEICYSSPVVALIHDVLAINENQVIAVGRQIENTASLILKSSDNGSSWKKVAISGSANLIDIYFTSSTTGYICGALGKLLKTTDGGESWSNLDSGTNKELGSIFFANDSVGYAVGGGYEGPIAIKTENGGDDWLEVYAPSGTFFRSVFFTNEQIGYIVGSNREILKTVDGGSNWEAYNDISFDSGYYDVLFTDENTGYIVGGDIDKATILKTNDAGENWEDISPNFNNPLFSISFPSPAVGYAVGMNGSVLKTETGGVLTSTSNPVSKYDLTIDPNPANIEVTVESINGKHITKIDIYNNNGQLISTRTLNSSKVHWDISEYKTGIYYLNIFTENGSMTKKLIKR